MAIVKCNDSWTAQLTEGKEYEVYAVYNQYYLIVDDMGRQCWEYCKNFDKLIGEIEKNFKYKTNWDVI